MDDGVSRTLQLRCHFTFEDDIEELLGVVTTELLLPDAWTGVR